MSHKATEWAFSIRGLSAGEFRVLVTLADCHNPSRGCFPSGAYLREACEMSNGALYENLNRLEAKGHIKRIQRGDQSGNGRAPSRYILGFEAGLSPENGVSPDSGEAEKGEGLIPAGRTPDSGPPETEQVREPVREEEPVIDLSSADPAVDETVLAFVAYNAAAATNGWAQAQVLNKPRRSSLKARLKEAGGLDGWQAALDRASASDFVSGRTAEAFRCDLDFLLQQKSFIRLMEGKYDNRDRNVSATSASPRRSSLEAGFLRAAEQRMARG
jgi:hypothetical protein